MNEAQAATGLDDFGPADFKVGFAVYLEHLEGESNLDDQTAARVRSMIQRRLTNRLEIEEWYKTHPEIGSVPVESPVFIVGLPRTGTTALIQIMSLDDRFRGPRMWEMVKPCPPPILEDELSDPRRLAAKEQEEQMNLADPGRMALHLYDADAPDEDGEILTLSFGAQETVLPIFSYHNWWREADLGPTMIYHRRVVQLLQSRRPPNQWLFKAPTHLFHLDAIASAYPDARFVMPHRDPAKAVASAVAFIDSLTTPGTGMASQMARFGQHHCDHLRIGMENAIAARERIGEHRFFDVQHSEFVSDPLGTLSGINDFLGLEDRPQDRERRAQWHAANQSGTYGVHRYEPEEHGLSKAQLRSDFDFYTQRFDVPLED